MTLPFLKRALTLVQNGYRVIPIPRGKKAPAEDGWERFKADEALVRRWHEGFRRPNKEGKEVFVRYHDGNIGIQTEHTPVVDLDILEEAVALEMQDAVTRILGTSLPIPVRIGLAPKRIILCCTATPFPKVTSPYFVSPDGWKHRVEILCAGQQFVSYGIHPDTHAEYEWITAANPLNTSVDELPSITHDQALRIVEAFCEIAQRQGWKKGVNGFHHETKPTQLPAAAIEMRPKLHIDTDELRRALALMDGADDYETWVRVGMGLHHQFNGAREGFDLWDEWSRNAPNYDHDALSYRWSRSFAEVRERGHGPITCRFIIKNANERLRQQEQETFEKLKQIVNEAPDFSTLTGSVTKQIVDAEMSDIQRSILARLVQKKASKFQGVLVPIKHIEAAVKPHPIDAAQTTQELEITLARRVLRTRFEDGAHIKRFNQITCTYRDGVWQRESEEYLERCVLETLTDLRHLNDPTLRKLMAQVDESRGDKLNALVSTITSVIHRLVAEKGGDDPLNLLAFEVPRIINCKNVELMIHDDGTLSVQEHNPLNALTSQLSCEYDPNATCPVWDASIRRVFQECLDAEAVIRHFYEIFGYILQPTREESLWVMFKGRGGSGKSFLLRCIAALMGPNSIISKSIAEIAAGVGNHFTTALIGKLMLLDDDLRAGTLLPDDWLKKLSEAKQLTADPKFGQPFQFVARSVPVILTNKWPATTDLSEGLKRRLQALEANHILTDDEKDPAHLRTILEQELPGVLNHLLAGLQRFLARGCRFDPPAECIAVKDRWLSASNPTIRFLNEAVARTAERHSVRAGDLYDAYIAWLRYWEIGSKPLGRNKFYEAMEVLGMRRTNHGGVMHFAHIKLRPIDGIGFDDLDDDGLEP